MGVTRPSMRFVIVSFFVLILGLFESLYGKAPAPSEQPPALEITLETSQSQPTVGAGLGVVAEIKNLSKVTIYLRENAVNLVPPPELADRLEAPRAWYAFFPTEIFGQEGDWQSVVALKPGTAYRVFWTHRPAVDDATTRGWVRKVLDRILSRWVRQVLDRISSEMNYLFFSPGDYKLTVELKYWTKPSLPNDDYFTATQSMTVRIASPQSVILFGAALGGLIAYFILPKARRKLMGAGRLKFEGFWHATWILVMRLPKEVSGILGAMLLSSIITILLARISETQFLVRVTVSDFWGAIAIGFVANYAGSVILDKIIPGATRSRDTSSNKSDTHHTE